VRGIFFAEVGISVGRGGVGGGGTESTGNGICSGVGSFACSGVESVSDIRRDDTGRVDATEVAVRV
jgi:hypothetical protein